MSNFHLQLTILTSIAIVLTMVNTDTRHDVFIGFVAGPLKKDLVAANMAVEYANQNLLGDYDLRLILIYEYDSNYSTCVSSEATGMYTSFQRDLVIKGTLASFIRIAILSK